jgi:hypothetical protein
MQTQLDHESVSDERDALLMLRLSGLALARTRVAPSLVDGGGRGLFASRDIDEGELVTLYPGDALAKWPGAEDHEEDEDHEDEDHEDEDEDEDEDDEDSDAAKEERLNAVLQRGLTTEVTFSVRDESTLWAQNWARREPAFVTLAWSYGVQQWPDRAIVGNPEDATDDGYLGHIVNDGARCTGDADAARYDAASKQTANVRMDTASLMECHHALIATRRIRQGEEIYMSYGRHYWLTRLAAIPQQHKTEL